MTPIDETSTSADRHGALRRHIEETSTLHMYQGRMNAALAMLSPEIIDVMAEHARPVDALRMRAQRATVLMHRNVLINAEQDTPRRILTEAIATAETLGDDRLLADLLDRRGWTVVYRFLFAADVYDPARGDFERALALREALGDDRGVAESLFHVGIVHQKRAEVLDGCEDEMKLAFEHYHRAYALVRGSPHTLELAYATRHLGFVHWQRGELDEALAYYQRSLALRQEIGMAIFFAPSYSSIGHVYRQMGRQADAADAYRRACAMAERIAFPGYHAAALIGLGQIHRDRGEDTDALDCFVEAHARAHAVRLDGPARRARRAIEALVG